MIFKRKETVNKKRISGFTLIELLVVITIIGVLTAAGLVYFVQAQKSARDAKRLADVKGIAQAMEQYNTSGNAGYPTVASSIDNVTYFPSGGRPLDPNGTAYLYTLAASAPPGGFCVCAALEIQGRGNATAKPNAGGTCQFGTPVGAQGYFCVQNQQ